MEKKTQADKAELNQDFWNERWANGQTGWDIGMPSPAIVEYFLQHVDRNASVLIPGCGNAYEALFLQQNGFQKISLIDISTIAVERLKEKFHSYPEIEIYCENFFDHSGHYDVLLEQTFFCALNPKLRKDYVTKSAELLKEKGSIIGLLFNRDFEKAGPPFGGHQEEYEKLFQTHFNIEKMHPAENSIEPRKGTELFIQLRKKELLK